MVILLCPNTRGDWDIGYGVIISNNEIGVIMNFVQGVNMNFAQGVIMNDEGDAVEFSPRNARKVWSSEKKEVIGFLFPVVCFLFVSRLRKPGNHDDIPLYE